MPVYRLAEGKYQIRINYGGRGTTPLTETFYGTKRDASARHDELRVEMQSKGLLGRQVGAVQTFSQLCQGAYRAQMRTWADSTYQSRRYTIATLCEHFGHRKLTRITTQHVEDFIAARQGVGTVNNGSINVELHQLRAILNFASKRSIPVRMPQIVLLPHSPNRERVVPYTDDEVPVLFEAMAGHDALVDMTRVIINTGMRKGEAIRAEWSWVDWAERLLRIPGRVQKSKRAREVPISDASLEVLHRRFESRASARWVFVQEHIRKGRGPAPRYAKFPAAWQERVDRAGLHGSPHTMRHTYASHYLRRRPDDIGTLARIMGHTHTEITEIYSHLIPGWLSHVRNTVDF